MAVNRIDWSEAAEFGDTVVYGDAARGPPAPHRGRHRVGHDGGVDGHGRPAWHVGTSPTTKPWLKLDELVVEEAHRPLDGGIDVSSITLRLADIDTGVTGRSARGMGLRCRRSPAASAHRSRPSACGRRRRSHRRAWSTSGAGASRTRARPRARSPAARAAPRARRRGGTRSRRAGPAKVYAHATGADALPFTLGRRVTVWALRITSAGTATDPTPITTGAWAGHADERRRRGVGRSLWTTRQRRSRGGDAADRAGARVQAFQQHQRRRRHLDGARRCGFTPLMRGGRCRNDGAYIAGCPPTGDGWTANDDLFLDPFIEAHRDGGHGVEMVGERRAPVRRRAHQLPARARQAAPPGVVRGAIRAAPHPADRGRARCRSALPPRRSRSVCGW